MMGKSVWDQARADLRGVHVNAQVARFCRLAGVAFVSQVGVLGSSHMSREALVAAAVGAIEVAVRQVFPVVSWDALKSKAAPAAAPAAGGVVPPGGGS